MREPFGVMEAFYILIVMVVILLCLLYDINDATFKKDKTTETVKKISGWQGFGGLERKARMNR